MNTTEHYFHRETAVHTLWKTMPTVFTLDRYPAGANHQKHSPCLKQERSQNPLLPPRGVRQRQAKKTTNTHGETIQRTRLRGPRDEPRAAGTASPASNGGRLFPSWEPPEAPQGPSVHTFGQRSFRTEKYSLLKWVINGC